jgi:regulator of replication initiation timing
MIEVLNWITTNNILIIKIGFSILFILMLLYLYQIFFTDLSSSNSNSSVDMDELQKKLTQILQQSNLHQNLTFNSLSNQETHADTNSKISTDTNPSADTAALINESNLLKAEILNLRKQLNDSEKKVFELAPTGAAVDTGSSTEVKSVNVSAEKQVSDSELTSKIQDLNKQVEVLQARLQEYEIIAEDISELSQLRLENNDLKKKLSQQLEKPIEAPATEFAEELAAELVAESKSSIEASAKKEGLPGLDSLSQNLVDTILSQNTETVLPDVASQKSDAETPPIESSIENVETIATADTKTESAEAQIPEIDKELMRDFEKLAIKS